MTKKKRGTTLQEPSVAEQEAKERGEALERDADDILKSGKRAPDVERHRPPGPGEPETRKAVIKQRFDRMLGVKLTDVELRERSRSLANSVTEIDKVETRKKAANDGFKAELERWYGVQANLSRQVDSGEESRMVECREVHDYRHKLVLVYRNDTNELIERREMSNHEYQQDMFDEVDPGDVLDETEDDEDTEEMAAED